MKRKRKSSLARLILGMLLIGAIEFAVGAVTPRATWAKPVPVSSSGDPTIGEDAPTSGPAKAASISVYTVMASTGGSTTTMRRPQKFLQVTLFLRQCQFMIWMLLR